MVRNMRVALLQALIFSTTITALTIPTLDHGENGVNELEATNELPGDPSSFSPITYVSKLLTRQDGENGCDCRKRGCTQNRISDPQNCRKCIKCKRTERPSSDGKTCVEKYDKRIESTRQDMQKKFDSNIEDVRQRQIYRFDRCIALSAVALGREKGLKYLDAFFTERLLSSDDVLPYYRNVSNMDIDYEGSRDGNDDRLEDEKFIDNYIKVGFGETGANKARGVVVRQEQQQQRQGFMRVREYYGRVGVILKDTLKDADPDVKDQVDRNLYRIAGNNDGKPEEEQKKALDDLIKEKNFVNCIFGREAEA
ncbi:hypothetical protein BU24DRAFT_416921 [Aaosphaeria arxii CBS 175.79]|uniref:Zn(2)-C6 fungal-type domain-containing protein n=1 Tax=Aaosphaeria arxii CBS 175.79 TaxID=1450172 RepID=A0A6A5Y9J2_9PLEO|nr:uncharacterized protein BU24DRAFT_416921 [Aaosphaeria arxii CBS 175.79]KAF2021264.1 hypothetical protein BU24DRAFT_416921 [Aaosphaeria arxii CBS 175.79]